MEKLTHISGISMLNKININIELIKNQIDSFCFLIEKKNIKWNIYQKILSDFCNMIIINGHLNRLEEEYKNKFIKINGFVV